jgi:hypothetical protein
MSSTMNALTAGPWPLPDYRKSLRQGWRCPKAYAQTTLGRGTGRGPGFPQQVGAAFRPQLEALGARFLPSFRDTAGAAPDCH